MESVSHYSELIKRVKRACERANRTDFPEIVAVSKFQPQEKIRALYEQGQKIFGENYVQELVEKSKYFQAEGLLDLDFHFIGHLQVNKVKLLLPRVSTIHSVDSLKLLHEIEKRAETLSKEIKVYLQINIDQEESKSGFLENELDDVLSSLSLNPWVTIIGFMCIPKAGGDPCPAFQRMREVSMRYRKKVGPGLSMGMSADYELAVEEGATSIRTGSALFGSRG